MPQGCLLTRRRNRRAPLPLASLQADADALAECPNYWVPREVVEGSAPAVSVAEQAVQQLYRRLVQAQLAPHEGTWQGAEYWCQVIAIEQATATQLSAGSVKAGLWQSRAIHSVHVHSSAPLFCIQNCPLLSLFICLIRCMKAGVA